MFVCLIALLNGVSAKIYIYNNNGRSIVFFFSSATIWIYNWERAGDEAHSVEPGSTINHKKERSPRKTCMGQRRTEKHNKASSTNERERERKENWTREVRPAKQGVKASDARIPSFLGELKNLLALLCSLHMCRSLTHTGKGIGVRRAILHHEGHRKRERDKRGENNQTNIVSAALQYFKTLGSKMPSYAHQRTFLSHTF